MIDVERIMIGNSRWRKEAGYVARRASKIGCRLYRHGAIFFVVAAKGSLGQMREAVGKLEDLHWSGPGIFLDRKRPNRKHKPKP